MLRSVVPVTTDTATSTSRRNFAANIETIAATGADADKPKVDRLWLETPDGKTAVELAITRCDATRTTFAVPDGISAGDYVLVAQRMNPDRRSFARARHKVRI